MRPMDLNTQRRRRKKKIKTVLRDENTHPKSEKSRIERPSKTSVRHSIDDLIDLAEGYLDNFEYESAQQVIQRALEIDADNPRALETAASLLIEGGDRDRALHCLGRAITVSPEKGYNKYFSLAELLEGRESLNSYLKGIEVLLKEKEENSQEEINSACGSGRNFNKDLSTAYISVAELWMTDLCDEDEAETSCEQAIGNAKQADPTNPEPLQTLANYLLIKGNTEGAKATLHESLAMWLPQLRAAAEYKGESEDPVELCPLSMPSRLAASKGLIELEEWDVATEVLELLLEEDDEAVEPWYLLGMLNYLRKENFEGNARFYLKKALSVSKKTAHKDQEMIEHIHQLLEELGTGEDEKSDDDDDYEDIDSEASSSDDDDTKL